MSPNRTVPVPMESMNGSSYSSSLDPRRHGHAVAGDRDDAVPVVVVRQAHRRSASSPSTGRGTAAGRPATGVSTPASRPPTSRQARTSETVAHGETLGRSPRPRPWPDRAGPNGRAGDVRARPGRPAPGRRRACGPSGPAAARRGRGTGRGRGRGACAAPAAPRRRRAGTGPSTSRWSGRSSRVRASSTAPGSPVTVATREAGGRCAAAAARRPRGRRSPAASHRTSACTAGWAGSPTTSARPPGRDQPDGVAPAPQRLLGRAQVVAAEQQPGVEQDDGRVAARGDRLGAGGGDDERGLVADVGEHVVAGRGAHPGCRGRRGRAPRRCAPRRAPARAARRRRTPGRTSRPPRWRTSGRPAGRWRAGQRERAGAGRAAGRGAAALAGQGQRVAGARRLHEHRPGRRAPSRIGVVGLLGHPRAQRVRVALEVVLGGAGDADGDPLAQPLAAARHARGPSRVSSRCCASTLRANAPSDARPRPRARRAAAAPRGCGGRAPAARRAGRRRRPSRRRGRGRAPARTPPRGCRRRPGGCRARRRGSRGSARAGPASAVSVTWWPAPRTRGEGGVDAGDVLAVGDAEQGAAAGGERRCAASSASRVGQSSPGAAAQTARGAPPSATWRSRRGSPRA